MLSLLNNGQLTFPSHFLFRQRVSISLFVSLFVAGQCHLGDRGKVVGRGGVGGVGCGGSDEGIGKENN